MSGGHGQPSGYRPPGRRGGRKRGGAADGDGRADRPRPWRPRRAGVDRIVRALFARHADDRRHDVDRRRYRGAALSTGFETYLAWTYAFSWLACLVTAVPAWLVAGAVAPDVTAAVDAFLRARAPVGVPAVPPPLLAAGTAGVAGLVAKRAVVWAGGRYLRWHVSARRTRIERTLPGAVRYLDTLASGSDDARTMVAKVAENDTYGGTAVSFRKALNAARLTGSLDAGLRRVARDTPSRDLLAPFLLKFRRHVSRGDEALAEYLHTESRLLAHRQEHARTRARRYLKPVAELFVLALVVPALLVVAVTVASVFVSSLSRPVATPLGVVAPRAVAVYTSVGFLLAVGLVGIAATGALRPVDARTTHRRPETLRGVLASAGSNPASASLVAVVPAVGVAALLAYAGHTLVDVSLLAYVAYALPVGVVAARRGRIDDAKDRRVADFVYAVAAHASVGRPLPDAVEAAARETDLGAVSGDVADLAFNLSVTTTADGDATGRDPAASGGVRAAALDRFVERVGTPLAARTVGLVGGALDAGSTVDTVFETLQVEVDRLTHEKRALRAAMRRYVVVGWVAALAVAGVVAGINVGVMRGDRLLAVATALDVPVDLELVHPELERFRLYVVAQATMLASGWFAGAAARGRYGALCHSGLLVAACHVGFLVAGVL